MAEIDWYKCRFLESSENLKPLVQKRFGKRPSASTAREITACLQQGRLFYEAAASSPLEIRPLQQFYGMVGFAKALVVARHLRSLSTLRHSHGLIDVSTGNSKLSELRLKIGAEGTFQDFNDVVAELSRARFLANAGWYTIKLPSTGSERLYRMEVTLKDVLSRIPDLETLYQRTFNEPARTTPIYIDQDYTGEYLRIRIDSPELFSDRDSLRRVVDGLRSRFSFLKMWRLDSAQLGFGSSILFFRDTKLLERDDLSEALLERRGEEFYPIESSHEERFLMGEGLHPLAGGYSGSNYAIAPLSGSHLSEFSLHYLALFLLSSLVRYRPQTWTHALSRSVFSEMPSDDQALSLIERFLDVNRTVIVEMVVTVLNPFEDRFVG
jgi:hypothetical protein